MTSSLNKFLNGKFSNLKQIGSKSWLVNDENNKTYVLNRHLDSDTKIETAYKINECLFKNPNNNYKTNFIFYEDFKIIDDYIFVLVEYCREGDFNKFLLDNRYKRQPNDEQIKNWILQLLRAVEFLNKNRILHKKLTTYTIMVHNGQLKIDGFEYAVFVKDESSIVDVDLNEDYGIFNCPEIVKKGKINSKYHVWCIGWIIYEICTCEWKFSRLLEEKFDDWKAPNLPDNYSKSFNNLFKKMIKQSPVSRSRPEKLIKVANEYFSREKIMRKKSDDVYDSTSFKDSLLKAFDQRFDRNFDTKDDDETVSDSDEENSASKSDHELDVSEKFKEKNKTFKGKLDEYKVKEIVTMNNQFSEFITVTKNKKRRALRLISMSNNTMVKNELNNLRDVLKKIKEEKNPFLVSIDEFFDLGSRLCYSTEVFEDGTLDKLISKLSNEKRNLSEDKIFDYMFYLYDAVSYLHDKRIVHKDIRPENIYLRNEKIKLGNFAVDYLIENKIKNMDNQESLACYYSPEIVVNGRLDARCDVWSIGCTVYEMFKLEPLFSNKDVIKIIKTSQIPIPDIDCRKKTKKIFYSMLKPLSERPNSKDIFKYLNDLVRKERETFENPTSYFDSD